jgi:hypothetical protein
MYIGIVEYKYPYYLHLSCLAFYIRATSYTDVGMVPGLWTCVARFFLVQYTKAGKNIPKDYKITKYP